MSVKDYENSVRDVGCVLCLYLGFGYSPASIHHVESIRDELSQWAICGLCPAHHQGPNGVHGLSRRGFEARFKLSQIDLLALVNKYREEMNK